MALADFSIKKPVTVIMFFLGVILFGFISWSKLPQELYPPITYPQLSVVTFYKDAAPEEMESLITKPIEEAVGTVSGVRRISSTSKEETSLVVAEFGWGTNMDFAALGVREKIDLIKESLPRGCDDPIVMKFNPFELPLMVLNITATKTPASELSIIVKKIIKNELEKAEGVAACNITGALTPEVLIEIDQDKLMSKGLAINEVVEAVGKANLNYPAGTIEESFYEYLIRTMGEFRVVGEMDDVVVGTDDRVKKPEYMEFGIEDVKKQQDEAIPDKRLILLKQIGKVKETFKEKTSVSRFKQKDNISVSVQKQADANTLKVANGVRDIISRLKKSIPKDVNIDIVYDQSSFVKSAIAGVADSAWQGGLLAFLVLFFFLRSAASAAIVTAIIPISIFAVFSLMYFSNITMNMISLGGLALGVGMLVDAGIVVVENIYRYRVEEKKPPREASILGTNEVSGAIAGSVLTTIVVFLPMIFVIGIAGQLFKELAFTVTFSLLGSWVVGMTLIPILSAKEKELPKGLAEDNISKEDIPGRIITFMSDANERILRFSINNKLLSMAVVFGVFILACFFIPKLDMEFMPKVDQGQFIIKLNLPPGTRLEVTDNVAQTVERHLYDMKEVDTVTVNIGSTKERKGTALLETMGTNEGQVIVNLKPLAGMWKKGEGYRTTPTTGVLERLKNVLKHENLRNARIEYILQESVFKSAFQAGAAIEVDVKGADLAKLRAITSKTEGMLKAIPGIYSIRNSLIDPAPEVKVNVFKEKATAYGLSVSEIALAAQTAVKGYIATRFKREGEEIDIRVRLRKQDRDNMAKIRALRIRSQLSVDVPLAEVAYFSTGKGPTEIKRQDQERVVIITANIMNRSFKEVSAEIEAGLKKMNPPSGYTAELTGENEQIQESFTSLQLALILSVVLVFMVMASQFESLWQPFIIMLTVPLSLIGVVFALMITHTPVSVMVALGFIVLGGIVVDNAIVLVDYINILQKEQPQMPVEEVLVLASRRRLRPILMTSLTTIFGLVPMSIAMDESSKLQQPMAITVMGGMIVTTFLSLVFIPTIYIGWVEFVSSVKVRFFGAKEPIPQPVFAEAREDYHKQKAVIVEEKPKIFVPKDMPIPKVEKFPDKVEKTETPLMIERKEDKKPIILPEKAPERETKERPAAEKPISKEAAAEESPGRGRISIDLWDSLAERQKNLIFYLRHNKKITRKEYAEKYNVSIPTAARDIKLLFDKGLIVAKGPAAIGRYYMLSPNC